MTFDKSELLVFEMLLLTFLIFIVCLSFSPNVGKWKNACKCGNVCCEPLTASSKQ